MAAIAAADGVAARAASEMDNSAAAPMDVASSLDGASAVKRKLDAVPCVDLTVDSAGQNVACNANQPVTPLAKKVKLDAAKGPATASVKRKATSGTERKGSAKKRAPMAKPSPGTTEAKVATIALPAEVLRDHRCSRRFLLSYMHVLVSVGCETVGNIGGSGSSFGQQGQRGLVVADTVRTSRCRRKATAVPVSVSATGAMQNCHSQRHSAFVFDSQLSCCKRCGAGCTRQGRWYVFF